MTAWYEGKDTPGLFVLGTAAHSRDYRSSAGGFVHGFRYTGDGLITNAEHAVENTNMWTTVAVAVGMQIIVV